MQILINHLNGDFNLYTNPSQTHAEDNPPVIESVIFTRKAKQEGKEKEIVESLRQSIGSRKDKARAIVETVRYWQDGGYIDAHFNARVMYDELAKLIQMPFEYDGFRKYYNE